MSDATTIPIPSLDYELITDMILREANRQAADAVSGTEIEIDHSYDNPKHHDDAIRLWLTLKVRAHEYRRLHYDATALGKHTFLVN